MSFFHGVRSHPHELGGNFASPIQLQTHTGSATFSVSLHSRFTFCELTQLKQLPISLNGTFGPHALADWPHHRLRVLSRHCFLFPTLSICRRWLEHHLPSSSLPLTFKRSLDNSEPEPTRCFTTPKQSSLQLSLLLNDLREISPVIEGLGCLCRNRHPVTAVGLPRLAGHPVQRFKQSLDC